MKHIAALGQQDFSKNLVLRRRNHCRSLGCQTQRNMETSPKEKEVDVAAERINGRPAAKGDALLKNMLVTIGPGG